MKSNNTCIFSNEDKLLQQIDYLQSQLLNERNHRELQDQKIFTLAHELQESTRRTKLRELALIDNLSEEMKTSQELQVQLNASIIDGRRLKAENSALEVQLAALEVQASGITQAELKAEMINLSDALRESESMVKCLRESNELPISNKEVVRLENANEILIMEIESLRETRTVLCTKCKKSTTRGNSKLGKVSY